MAGALIAWAAYLANTKPKRKSRDNLGVATGPDFETLPARLRSEILKNARRAEKKCAPGRAINVWKSTREVASEVIDQADFENLDPGSDILHDTFCRKINLKGKRCPKSWVAGLQAALSHGGERSFDGLEKRPGWRAFSEAYKAASGQDLPLPEGALEARLRKEQAEKCLERVQEITDEKVKRASNVPF